MPDGFFIDYSHLISGRLIAKKLGHSRLTQLVLESRIALFEHCFQFSGATSAMRSYGKTGGFARVMTVECLAPARIGSDSRYLTAMAGLEVRMGGELLRRAPLGRWW
jgi:hypothetical protein